MPKYVIQVRDDGSVIGVVRALDFGTGVTVTVSGDVATVAATGAGTLGATGSFGPPGADGDDGRDGAPGAAGASGADGARGSPGDPGEDGQDGATFTVARIRDFGASGALSDRGLVPDPGAVAGTAKFLREDATWTTPTASVAFSFDGANWPYSVLDAGVINNDSFDGGAP